MGGELVGRLVGSARGGGWYDQPTGGGGGGNMRRLAAQPPLGVDYFFFFLTLLLCSPEPLLDPPGGGLRLTFRTVNCNTDTQKKLAGKNTPFFKKNWHFAPKKPLVHFPP